MSRGTGPAPAPVARLLRLSQLRSDLAARAVMAGETALACANAALQDAVQARADLAVRMARRAQALRNGFVSAPRSRAAIQELLGDLQATDDTVAAADAAVTEAGAHRDACRDRLAGLRADAAVARGRVVKRKRMLAPIKARIAAAREARDEAEAAETHMARSQIAPAQMSRSHRDMQ